MESIYKYIDEHKKEYLSWLFEACSQPSISAQNIGMSEMADLVKEYLDKLGAENVELVPTGGYPFVYGEMKGKQTDRTLSFYNHYDVQPVEPIEPDFAVFSEKTRILKKGMQCSWGFRKSGSRKLKCSA
jgi:acetylornithine deacetylase/succinyl-diaminopimelate desuccinylase-like protein